MLATAMGAATAGAALAVIAMKMIESSKDDKDGSSNSSSNSNPNGTANRLAYHAHDQRLVRTSVIMNDPSDLHDSISHGSLNMQREASDAMLFPHNHEEKMRRRIATRYTIEEENNLRRDSVTVRVPATSANVGPGCEYCDVL